MEASELILTQRGSVYHLDLRPEEISNTVILVGDPERVAWVSARLDSIELKRQHREFITHTGYLGKRRISVISTGIGTDNVDIVLQELDALVNIDLDQRQEKTNKQVLQLIRIGTSGALQADLPVDSFLVSSIAIGMDNLMSFYECRNTEAEKDLLNAFVQHTHVEYLHFLPYVASASTALIHELAGQLPQGLTLTCPGFYGPQGRRLRLPLAYPQLLQLASSFRHNHLRCTNFEMETAALYGLSAALGHQAISFNALVANRITRLFSADPQRTIVRLIELVLERLHAAA
ncbi:MAG: nucleoside phosphorylase [Chitinophagales bacterium]|nr:nucleoside phosphorylase [Chitinophagales bacterium]MDW8427911.1 nucleoside phosphorylase [Chitinophagales bacterium]